MVTICNGISRWRIDISLAFIGMNYLVHNVKFFTNEYHMFYRIRFRVLDHHLQGSVSGRFKFSLWPLMEQQAKHQSTGYHRNNVSSTISHCKTSIFTAELTYLMAVVDWKLEDSHFGFDYAYFNEAVPSQVLHHSQ